MKIGIVGGTFNPIHLGHLMLGEYAHSEYNLEEIWFMPNGNPPHKYIDMSECSTEKRIEMTKIAIEGISYFKYQSYEIERSEKSYSYQTMETFAKMYEGNEFFFIIGSDSLFSLEEWKCPEKLVKLCTILVACRENLDIALVNKQISYLEQKFECKIILLQMPILEVSSSDIRNRVKLGKTIKYIVPDEVSVYINNNKLYEDA